MHQRRRTSALTATWRLTALFTATLFLSSALVFIVEPMFAKMILPLLGGSPAVWNTCMVFFQAVLLAGYAYAHLTTSSLTIRQQAAAHAALLLAAAFALPVAIPHGSTPPVDSTPVPWLLLTLVIGLGGPFLMVSATAPLLQKWFAGTDHSSAGDPYFLYAASNVGSIVALIAYPFIVEPLWSLSDQARMWTVGYLLFSVLTIACAAVAVRAAADRDAGHVNVADLVRDPEEGRISWAQRATWVARAFVPSSLLLGVTTYLSTDIAAVPLLWTVPLTLYLLSFVFAFSPAPLVSPRLATRAMPILVCVLVLFMATPPGGPIWLLIPLHLAVFFVCALHLHTAVATDRPRTRFLTEFYLWIAFAGVLGGLFNTFLAPLLFTSIVEYPAAIVAACLLQSWKTGASDRRLTWADVLWPLAIGAVTAVLASLWARQDLDVKVFVALMTAIAVVCFSFSRRPIRFGFALAMMLLGALLYQPATRTVLASDRTFFGVLRVRADAAGGRHILMHGSTVHGEQHRDAAQQTEPLTYYHRAGPIGQVMDALSGPLSGARIAVVGLGAGSLAAYARSGQQWTFYEIDPAVERIARDPALFTYLRACGNACDVVLGDARLSLARPGVPMHRLLVLDAFSSDGIPVHLVTREALDLYLSKLEAAGVIAFHISNRHLHLRPVLAALAAERRLAALVQHYVASPADIEEGRYGSEWLLMARSPAEFGSLSNDSRWERPEASRTTRVWTDDFSNILAVLKKR